MRLDIDAHFLYNNEGLAPYLRRGINLLFTIYYLRLIIVPACAGMTILLIKDEIAKIFYILFSLFFGNGFSGRLSIARGLSARS